MPSTSIGRSAGTLLRIVSALCFPLRHGCLGSYPSHTTLFFSQLMHPGFVSSHFFFRLRHVPQPVLDLACDAFFCSTTGCFRGLPRLRGVGKATGPAVATILASSRSSSGLSSSSSILGTIEPAASSSLSGVMTLSVVNSGEELEVVEYVE